MSYYNAENVQVNDAYLIKMKPPAFLASQHQLVQLLARSSLTIILTLCSSTLNVL